MISTKGFEVVTTLMMHDYKMRSQLFKSLMRAGRTLIIPSILMGSAPLLAFAEYPGKVAGDDVKKKDNAQLILKNFIDIVDHGDLGDESFFASTLGLSLGGGEKKHVTGYQDIQYLRSLPYPGSAKYHDWDVQQYYYIDVPDYFEEDFGRNGYYVQPYAKAFLSNGKIGVIASIVLNTEQLCITESDIKSELKDNYSFSESRGAFTVRYSAPSRSDIEVELRSTYTLPTRCVKYVDFSQNLAGIR